MTLAEAIFCGILQGLTEFLPISSSGHLALAHALFGLESSESYLTFDILLHLATLLVVFVVYCKEIFSLVPAFFTLLGKLVRGKFRLSEYTKSERLVVLLILATLPLAAAFFIEDTVEALAGYTRAVGLILILNGIVLFISDRFAAKAHREELTPAGAVGVGLFQLAAIFPGLSRSGSTISGGMLFGLDRKEAVKFSFLMSIPAILGANITNLPEVVSQSVTREELGIYLVGMLCAAAAGFAAMKLLQLLSEKKKFGIFAYYSVILGAAAAIFG